MMVFWLQRMFTHQFWDFIPFEQNHPTIIALELQIAVQYFACIVGILGVLCSNKTLLKVYWLLMIPLLFFDIVMAVLLMFRMKNVHSTFHSHFDQKIDEHVTSKNTLFCSIWESLQQNFDCCPPKRIEQFCDQTPQWANETSCFDEEKPCNAHILRWMHKKTDFVGVIIFFMLFPLKLVVVLVLREDIGALFSEIVYSNNAKLYKHWDDEDEMDYVDATPPETNIFAA
ncbi:unnamed protein product, partial [Mesorhabditis belari]|uniref:Tetraspanin n=1 Tax=Mesorhabditis belari TaxID=2138241 RepID=A0AAF3ER28_9BILA